MTGPTTEVDSGVYLPSAAQSSTAARPRQWRLRRRTRWAQAPTIDTADQPSNAAATKGMPGYESKPVGASTGRCFPSTTVDPGACGNRRAKMIVAFGEGNLPLDNATTPAARTPRLPQPLRMAHARDIDRVTVHLLPGPDRVAHHASVTVTITGCVPLTCYSTEPRRAVPGRD